MSDKVLTTEELEKKWDTFSKTFQYYNEPSTLPVCFLLLTNLGITSNFGKISEIKSILEIACGAGAGTQLCLNYKKDSIKYTATDISHEMIQLAKDRLGIDSSTNEIESKNFKIEQSNAENLLYKDNSFDRYFANFCIHLVPSPEKMLKESYRVLEVGGVAAFSVWGRPENSNQFTITGKMAKEVGIVMNSASRSPFHLGDINKLRQLALDAGFSRVLAGYSSFNAPITSGEEYADMFFSPPDTQTFIKTIEEEKYKLWRSKVVNHVDDLLKNGTFVGQEVAYIVCTK